MIARFNPQRALGDELARTQAAANICGRLGILRDAAHKTRAPLRFCTNSRLMQFADSARDRNPNATTVYTSFNVPQTGAVEYLRSLTPVTRSVFDGLTAQYRADAFTLSALSDTRVIARVRDELSQVIANGGTSADFQKALDELQSKSGVEAVTADEIDNLFAGMAHKAYAAGRYEQLSDESISDALPYWQYWTVGDDRVRPEHRVLDRFCALGVDPVWHKIYPPCGYGCRCSVVALSASEAPEGSDDGGLNRLPALAIALVPQPGFTNILAFAA